MILGYILKNILHDHFIRHIRSGSEFAKINGAKPKLLKIPKFSAHN